MNLTYKKRWHEKLALPELSSQHLVHGQRLVCLFKSQHHHLRCVTHVVEMRSLAHRAEIIQQSSRNREERGVGSARVCPPPGLGPERYTPSCPHKPATAKAIPVGCWKFRSCDRETRRTPQSSTSKRESFLGIWGTSRGICGFFPPKSQLAAQTGLPLQRSSDGSSSLGKTRASFYPRKCKKTVVLLGRRRGRLTVTKMPATHVSSSAHSPGSLASPPSCSFSLHRSHGLPGAGAGAAPRTRQTGGRGADHPPGPFAERLPRTPQDRKRAFHRQRPLRPKLPRVLGTPLTPQGHHTLGPK